MWNHGDQEHQMRDFGWKYIDLRSRWENWDEDAIQGDEQWKSDYAWTSLIPGMNVSGYDLANKIDWEGGISEYFLRYSSASSFEGTPFEGIVKEYAELQQKLENLLREYRAHPEDL